MVPDTGKKPAKFLIEQLRADYWLMRGSRSLGIGIHSHTLFCACHWVLTRDGARSEL